MGNPFPVRTCKWLVVLTIGATWGCTAADGLPAGVPGRDRPARVVLYGDSLADQAAPFFRQAIMAHGKALLRMKTGPGTAPCDWLADMSQTAKRFRPDAAVVEFSGNNLTRCMRDSAGNFLTDDAVVARYRADADKATRALTHYGATVYWIGTPPDRSPSISALAARIKAVYQELPSRFDHVRFVDAGQAVTDHGTYTDYLPCLPNETCTGPVRSGVRTDQVRAPDGVHFCPVTITGKAPCPVWSSGAFRFGTAMAAPVISDFRI